MKKVVQSDRVLGVDQLRRRVEIGVVTGAFGA
jgi:hypothetical protein